MVRKTILIVEDEEDILELVRYNLAKEGFDVVPVTTGEEALEQIEERSPHLVLLDLMLPGIDGLEVCRTLKSNLKTKDIPIVMLTAKGEEADIVAGLELGADDYVTKPFSPRVLLARVRAVLRRKSEKRADTDTDVIISFHNVTIHPGRHEVFVDGAMVELSPTEFKVLHFLAQRPGWVFTRYQIVDAVHGEDYPVTDRSVDVQISGLRKKLGSAGNLIETIHRVGYKIRE